VSAIRNFFLSVYYVGLGLGAIAVIGIIVLSILRFIINTDFFVDLLTIDLSDSLP